MKPLRIFPLVSCCVMALYLLFFSFPGLSLAEQAPDQSCISSCESAKQACFNINADRRLCEVDFQDCVDACKKARESSSSPATPAPVPAPAPKQPAQKIMAPAM